MNDQVLAELRMQLERVSGERDRWKQLYKDAVREIEAMEIAEQRLRASHQRSLEHAAGQLNASQQECDRYRQLQENALAKFYREQADHAQTRGNLLKILSDTLMVRAS